MHHYENKKKEMNNNQQFGFENLIITLEHYPNRTEDNKNETLSVIYFR